MLISKEHELILKIHGTCEDYVKRFTESDPEIAEDRIAKSYDIKVDFTCKVSNNIREGAWEHIEHPDVVDYHSCEDPNCLEIYMFRKCPSCKEIKFNEDIAIQMENNELTINKILVPIWQDYHYHISLVAVCDACMDEINEELDEL